MCRTVLHVRTPAGRPPIRAWRRPTSDGPREVDDATYLRVVRSVHNSGLRKCRVGVHIRYVVDELGGDVSRIVYTNAARCQFPELPPAIPGASARKLALRSNPLTRIAPGRLASSRSAPTQRKRLTGQPSICADRGAHRAAQMNPLASAGAPLFRARRCR